MKRFLLIAGLLCAAQAFASTQFFLTTQTPTESGNYQPCTVTARALHGQRGAGVTTSVTASAAGGSDIATTDTSGGNELCFVSDPVLTSTNIANSAGSVTFNIWGFESATQCNCTFRVKVYKYDGNTETLIVDASDTAEHTSNVAVNWTGTPSATTLNVGDRLVIRTRITNVGSMAGGRTVTMNYAGTTAAASGDSYVTFTENIPLKRTRTVKSAGGDYTSFSGWNTGERADLTTLLEARYAELYSMQDTTAAGFGAVWVTSPTYHIKVYTPASERSANGVYDTSKYRLEVTDANAISIGTNAADIWFDGLQIKVTATTVSKWAINATSGTNVANATYKLSNSILVGVYSGSATSGGGIFLTAQTGGATPAFTAWNNVAYDMVNGANASFYFISSRTGWTSTLYNNTAYNSYKGYSQSGGTFISINNAAMSCTDGFEGTFDATSDYNASDIASDAPGAHSQNGSAAAFVDAASRNFQPAYTDTVLKGNGTTDPGSGLFSTDITGASRSNPWDIGAFIVQATPSAHPHTLTTLGVGN